MKSLGRMATWCVGAILIATSTAMADVANGGFDNGLSSWTVRGNVDVQVYPLGQYARLQEPGAGGVSQIWQSVLLPSAPAAQTLTFRYRFIAPRNTASPQLIAAFTRKVHGLTGPTIDLDILAGETECRSATIAG